MIDKEKLIKLIDKNRRKTDSPYDVVFADTLIDYINSKQLLIEKPKEACRWVLPPDSSDSMDYETECGHKVDEEYILIKNPYKYCPYCSKEIQVVEDE